MLSNPQRVAQILINTGILMIAGAAAAMAATAGWPADAPVNSAVNFISTDVAFAGMGTGCAGIAAHFVSGRELGHVLHYSVGALIGGGVCTGVRPLAGATGISAGAVLGYLPVPTEHSLIAFGLGALASLALRVYLTRMQRFSRCVVASA